MDAVLYVVPTAGENDGTLVAGWVASRLKAVSLAVT